MAYLGLLPLRLRPVAMGEIELADNRLLGREDMEIDAVEDVQLLDPWRQLFGVSAPVVILFALLSCLWIEKPFLEVKPYALGQK